MQSLDLMTTNKDKMVLNLVHKPTKLDSRTFGSFTITFVHVNEKNTMELRLGLRDHINVRRVIPYISRINHGPPMRAIGLFHTHLSCRTYYTN